VDEQVSKIERVEVGEDHAPAPSSTLNHLPTIQHGDTADGIGSNTTSGRQDDISSNAGGYGEGRGLQPVSEVVDVAGHTPPSRGKEPGASLRLEVGRVLEARLVWVGAEGELLRVGEAEDGDADDEDTGDKSKIDPAKVYRVDGEIATLGGVEEGDPDDVAKRKHEAQAVGDNVHHAENARLRILSLQNIVALDGGDEQDAVRDVTVIAVLLGDKGQVEQDPASQARTHFQPCLDVNLAKEGEGDTGVEFPAYVVVVDEVARVSAASQLSQLAVARLDAEAADVDPGSDNVGKEDAACQELEVVVADEGPDNEVRAIDVRADRTCSQLNNRGMESYDRDQSSV
jgi:hypothetical protein